ncbi:hypothetical protein PAXINDRAFT_13241 [Paxillus involutus ATCC 200175]|uniref:Uncharacterized protein n=1 Tax=Paxillus involutus ATCC 200175 TaxID=664439 RepID=A0A0C9TE98_PAXIN|nr:hypothetical protein PAXINDRAFT_13241 [Paxillus involutus ATCC 200175]
MASPNDSQSSSTGNVNWDSSSILTTNLIQYLLSHPANRHLLFHDHAAAAHVPIPGDKASGKNKREVQAVIAKHLFQTDPVYGTAYASLSTLKRLYRAQRTRLSSTGQGVAPGAAHPNLLADICAKYPFYNDLDSMWRGIPSFDPDLLSSESNINHAESLLDAVKNRSNKDADGNEDNDLDAADDCPAEEEAFPGNDIEEEPLVNDEAMKDIGDEIAALNEADGGANAFNDIGGGQLPL